MRAHVSVEPGRAGPRWPHASRHPSRRDAMAFARSPSTPMRWPGKAIGIVMVAALVSAAVVATSARAAAAAPGVVPVGAGSYTTDDVGPLPSGCGDLSTNPRQFLTDSAPAGAI